MNQIKHKLGRLLSGSPKNQLLVYTGVFVIVFLLILIVSCAGFDKDPWNVVVAVLSPVPINKGKYHLLKLFAYIIGLILFSGGLVAVITNIIRTIGDRYLNGTAHYHFKNHILFLGYDELMMGTLRNFLNPEDNGKPIPEQKDKTKCKKYNIVVAVPDNVANVRNIIYEHLTKEEQKQVIVIQISRTSVDDLKSRAWVTKADRIFIIGQPNEDTHDAENLKCLGLIGALCTKKSPKCMYYLRNQATFYLVHRLSYKAEDFKHDIEQSHLKYDEKHIGDIVKASSPFNFCESIARHILFDKKEHMQLDASNGYAHLIIYGMTTMGVALMRDVLMTQHFPNGGLRVTMVDENAKEEMHYLIGRHRPFFESCHYSFRNLNDPAQDYDHPAKLNFLDADMEFIQCDVAHPDLSEYLCECVAKGVSSIAIAICTDDSPKNMALALYLPQMVLEKDVPIWVYQNGDNSMNAFVKNESSSRYKNIHIFSTQKYGVKSREESLQWRLAKAASIGYAHRHPEAYTKEPYHWDTEQPQYRWSSLYGAISKISMIRAVGVNPYSTFELNVPQKDMIAKAEHNRWNTEKLLNGWYPADWGIKDEFNHECIRPFEDLDNDPQKRNLKQKDYEQIEDVEKELNKINDEKARKISAQN